mmetsp:Transcript_4285/g.8431  ORF Transcript_4285/g.8431 Transcript_4285/m.8431 type:complete len:205 (+) Transcript_4285:881-1495(+)
MGSFSIQHLLGEPSKKTKGGSPAIWPTSALSPLGLTASRSPPQMCMGENFVNSWRSVSYSTKLGPPPERIWMSCARRWRPHAWKILRTMTIKIRLDFRRLSGNPRTTRRNPKENVVTAKFPLDMMKMRTTPKKMMLRREEMTNVPRRIAPPPVTTTRSRTENRKRSDGRVPKEKTRSGIDRNVSLPTQNEHKGLLEDLFWSLSS